MDVDDAPKRGRGRGRGARGAARGTRGRGRGRGRGKKRVISSESEEPSEDEQSPPPEPVAVAKVEDAMEVLKVADAVTKPVAEAEIVVAKDGKETDEIVVAPTIDMEADISQLEAPTFTTLQKRPIEPMLRLNWDQKVNLIGEKVLNPMIHCCDKCIKPILIYGRMIPCKHVFCLECARSENYKVCPRCKEKVIRVEQTGLGTVFMCTYGGSRYGNSGCRRTYLSQRDLQAHINHRHRPVTAAKTAGATIDTLTTSTPDKSAATTNAPRKSTEATPTTARPRNPSQSSMGGNVQPIPSVSRNIVETQISEAQQASWASFSTAPPPQQAVYSSSPSGMPSGQGRPQQQQGQQQHYQHFQQHQQPRQYEQQQWNQQYYR